MFQINESTYLEIHDGEGEFIVACPLKDFVADNEVVGDEYVEIANSLKYAGYYEGGGGAAASYVLIVSA
jgi:hypothetical protein